MIVAAFAGAANAQNASLFGYTTPAYLGFNSPSYSASPGDTNAVITILRTGEFRIPITVNYATHAGTASVGQDYLATEGILRIPAGVGLASFSVPLVPNRIDGADKTVQLTLSNVGAGGEITGGNATLHLLSAGAGETNSLPKLALRADGQGQMVVSWPNNGTVYLLERAGDPCQGRWASVNATPQINAGKCQVIEPVSAGPVFYRLRAAN